MLKLFSQPTQTATIPQFDQGEKHDSIDLQVKSLLYLFKRLRINKLASFLHRDTNKLKYVDDFTVGDDLQKLDQMYNMTGFVSKITADEYRIMVDFIKNKFRSWCLLSDMPSDNIRRPSCPKDYSNHQDFPDFIDYRDRVSSKYKFVLFPLSTSIDLMTSTLAQSDIYCEHSIDYEDRLKYARGAVLQVIPDRFDLDNQSQPVLITEDEKKMIIEKYLYEMAFSVQLNRIYWQHLKIASKPTVDLALPATPRLSRKQSAVDLRGSPTKSRPISPGKEIPPTPLSWRSPTKERPSTPTPTSRPASPTKSLSPTKTLRSKPSISKFQFEELYNPVVSPPYETNTNSSDVSDPDDKPKLIERPDIHEKCKLAIKHCLKLEKAKVK